MWLWNSKKQDWYSSSDWWGYYIENATALKIAPVYHAPVVHLKDASQNASVASKLLNPQLKAELVNELNSEYEALREKSGLLKRETVSIGRGSRKIS